METTIVVGLLVIILVLTGCTSNPETSEFDDLSVANKVVADDSFVDDVMITYAELEAKIGCEVTKAGLKEDQEALLAAMSNAAVYAEEYGFTQEELLNLSLHYQNNEDFAFLVLDNMREFCSDVVETLFVEQ
ncbi:hypothetical protein K9M74_04015 [Candidatus Woesearchaeota archaeon]|nr:hypothetical protein [Candidatus Woesearchaeota archaeon]